MAEILGAAEGCTASSAKRYITCSEPGCEATKLKARGRCAKHYRPAKRYPPRSLRPEEVRALLAAAEVHAPSGVQNVALIWLLYKTGLRDAEALALMPHDLDWSEQPRVSIFVGHGKGDKSRKVSMAAAAIPAVKRWLALRQENGFGDDKNIFCSASGRALQTSHVRRLFRRLGKKAGVRGRVHPHALRHTYAAEAARKKVRPELIQRQLGHDDLGTTTRYLATISAAEVIEALWDL